MSKFIRFFAACLLLAGLPMAARAQVNVSVQVQVVGNCSVSAPSNANFGSVGPLASTAYTATGAVTLTCNRGATPFVAVGPGNNFNVTRRMREGATANYVGYLIKQPTLNVADYTTCPAVGGGSAFGTGTDRLDASATFVATGGQRTVNLCFESTLDQNTPIAIYADIVQVSVTLI